MTSDSSCMVKRRRQRHCHLRVEAGNGSLSCANQNTSISHCVVTLLRPCLLAGTQLKLAGNAEEGMAYYQEVRALHTWMHTLAQLFQKLVSAALSVQL